MDYSGYNDGYNTGYTQQYSVPAALPYAQPFSAPEISGFNIMDYTPLGILRKQVWCMAVGIVIFMVLMYFISWIPLVGPWISNTIKYLITKLAEFAGVLKCDMFANDFDAVLEAEG